MIDDWKFIIAGVLYQAQDSLLYHPEIPPQSRIFVPLPSMHGLPYDTVHIRSTDNVSLHAYWIRHAGEKGMFVPTLVYFHGNAGNMGHRLHNASGIFHTLQCNLLMVEYRGYGLSTGVPTENGLCADARAAIDYLFTRHDLDLNQIVLFGRSLGGAVAIDLAADTVYSQRIMCVILENTFTSIPDMACELIHRYIKYLPMFCFKNKVYRSRWNLIILFIRIQFDQFCYSSYPYRRYNISLHPASLYPDWPIHCKPIHIRLRLWLTSAQPIDLLINLSIFV